MDLPSALVEMKRHSEGTDDNEGDHYRADSLIAELCSYILSKPYMSRMDRETCQEIVDAYSAPNHWWYA